MKKNRIYIDDVAAFKNKALHFAHENYKDIFLLDDCNIGLKYGGFTPMLAFGSKRSFFKDHGNSFNRLKDFICEAKMTILGFLSYDLKNELENLESRNPDHLNFPDIYFIEPQIIITFLKDSIQFEGDFDGVYDAILNFSIPQTFKKENPGTLQSRFTKEEYIHTVKEIQKHIFRGDIYEMNFCMEFYIEESHIDPLETYLKLSSIAPMPFSSFIKLEDKYLLCASPERYLKKENDRLISQPIKGTIRRGANREEDESLIKKLENSEKERAENIMIVDLVRNDMAKTAVIGSVKVEELCSIYSFSHVHQMISTIVSNLDPDCHFLDAISTCFPMGSMTGAPKVSALQLIEKFERSKRGLFSGSVGYINPNNDFDFNVVIRSIIYNKKSRYLSFQVGSAITSDADPEKEYEECLVKTKAILESLY